MISDDKVEAAGAWLKDPDVDTRDAVIHFLGDACETGSRRARDILEAHVDEVGWLRDYARRVVKHYRELDG